MYGKWQRHSYGGGGEVGVDVGGGATPEEVDGRTPCSDSDDLDQS